MTNVYSGNEVKTEIAVLLHYIATSEWHVMKQWKLSLKIKHYDLLEKKKIDVRTMKFNTESQNAYYIYLFH